MDVREAARTAKTYIADVFAEEDIDELGLEEVDFDDRSNLWKITISFLRPRGRNGQVTGRRNRLSSGHPDNASILQGCKHRRRFWQRRLRQAPGGGRRGLIRCPLDAMSTLICSCYSSSAPQITALIRSASSPASIRRALDYELLVGLLSNFQQILVTPNTLTETSNLLGQHGEPQRSRFFDTFQLTNRNQQRDRRDKPGKRQETHPSSGWDSPMPRSWKWSRLKPRCSRSTWICTRQPWPRRQTRPSTSRISSTPSAPQAFSCHPEVPREIPPSARPPNPAPPFVVSRP